MTCPKCNHAHAGPALAFICVGCPCPETPDSGGFANALGRLRTLDLVVGLRASPSLMEAVR